MLDGSGGLERIDGHAADWIFVGFTGWIDCRGCIARAGEYWLPIIGNEFRRVGDELVHASRRAEAVSDAPVLGVASGLNGIDRHAADGVFRQQ
jgi:hypothetical protein